MDGPARIFLDKHAAATILRPVVPLPGSDSVGVRYLLAAHNLLHGTSAFPSLAQGSFKSKGRDRASGLALRGRAPGRLVGVEPQFEGALELPQRRLVGRFTGMRGHGRAAGLASPSLAGFGARTSSHAQVNSVSRSGFAVRPAP